MAVNVFLRRQAERFAELVDSSTPGTAQSPDRHHPRGHHPRGDDTMESLARLGRRLSDQSEPFAARVTPDPGFRADLRQRLMADAAVHGIGVTRVDDEPDATVVDRRPIRHSPPVVRRRPRARLIIVGGVVAGGVAISSVAAASNTAMPGDALYSVKRSTERAQIAMAGSNLNSGELYLQFARIRAAEAAAVRHDPHRLIDVLTTMDRQTRYGVSRLDSTAVSRRDPAPLREVATFATRQRPRVAKLLPELTGQARARTLRSLSLLDEVRRRVDDLHRLLLCTAGEPVQTDTLGPVPQDCSALPGAVPAPSSGPTDSSRGSGSPDSGRATDDRAGTGPTHRTRPSTPPRTHGPTEPSPGDPTPSTAPPSARPTPGHGPLHNLLPDLPKLPGVPGVTRAPLPKHHQPPTTVPSPPTGTPSDGSGIIGTISKILGGLL